MLRDSLYRGAQRVASAWLRRRRSTDFADVESFCLFVGYPRSGHSIVGSLLNAHRHAVIAHEAGAQQLVLDGCSRDELYARILARAHWFALRGSTTNYRYAVAGQWQGRYERLRVIGDKRGGAVSRAIAADPGFLERVRTLVGVPLRLLHVVRDPFDNIASISLSDGLSLEASADYYFRHRELTARLPDLVEPGELFTLRHEELIRAPAATVRDVCAFLALEPDRAYVDACAASVFPAPTRTGTRVDWPRKLVASIERRCAALGVAPEPRH
jgi:hypothetical protein